MFFFLLFYLSCLLYMAIHWSVKRTRNKNSQTLSLFLCLLVYCSKFSQSTQSKPELWTWDCWARDDFVWAQWKTLKIILYAYHLMSPKAFYFKSFFLKRLLKESVYLFFLFIYFKGFFYFNLFLKTIISLF